MIRNYKKLKELGRGVHGVGWLSKNVSTNELVVIKEINNKNDKEMLKFKEISLLNLPYVPKLYEAWSENNKTYIVMEYIEGVTLGNYLKKNVNKVDEIASRLLRVVKDLHSKNWGHGDLTTWNIIYAKDDRICLIDFEDSCSRIFDCSLEKIQKKDIEIFYQIFVDHKSKILTINVRSILGMTIRQLCYEYFKDEVVNKGYQIDLDTNISVMISGQKFNLGDLYI